MQTSKTVFRLLNEFECSANPNAEFISEFGKYMPSNLIDLLNQHVSRLQCYCDDRILEPK